MSEPVDVDGLPKAELHVHLEGTLEPGDMIEFARRNGVPLPWADERAVAAAYSYTGLDDFLRLYWQGCTVLRTAQDVHDLALTYLTRAAAENVRRAEVFFSPQNFLDRIDHGLTAAADPDLVARLADDGIPLTMCPLSNLRLRLVDDLARHPIRDLLAAGVPVTVNSDDPPYFGGGLGDNYRALIRALDLTGEEVVALARSGFTASFADPGDIATALAEIASHITGAG